MIVIPVEKGCLDVVPGMAQKRIHIYGTLYDYRYSAIYQIFEQKYCAVYAVAFLIAAIVSLLAAAKKSQLGLDKF